MQTDRKPKSGGPSSALCRRGGTLLEVLISLVVLTMILQLVVEVAGHDHATRTRVQRQQLFVQAATTWQIASEAGESWAQGRSGEFPDHAMRWRVTRLDDNGGKSLEAPDGLWRALELQQADGTEWQWQTMIRLPEPKAATRPTTKEASHDRWGGGDG